MEGGCYIVHFEPLGRVCTGLLLSKKFRQPVIQSLKLRSLRGSTSSPSDPTMRVNEVDIANLSVHHTNSFLQHLVESFLDQEVSRMLLQWQLLAHAPHKALNQPCPHEILLNIDIHLLNMLAVVRKQLCQTGVLLRSSERTHLSLSPYAREHSHNADLAA